jgi:predicted GH43/DUF377 family glycosyl hydrolase
MLARVAETPIQTDPSVFSVPSWRNGHYELTPIQRNDPAYDFSDPRVIKNHRQNYLTSVSHFAVGESKDGIHFSFRRRGIFPEGETESFGIEDPRIARIDGRYYITYAAVSPLGINVGLMVTSSFYSFRRLGILFPSDNKDCVLFPRRIKGRYMAFHRPSATDFGKLILWLAESPDLFCWGCHRPLPEATISYGKAARTGAGAPPFLTKKGWVEIYHSADEANHYHLTAMLLDARHPERILAKSRRPLIEPTEEYEKKAFSPDVLFTCGLIPEKNRLLVYYGAGDQSIAVAILSYDELWANLGIR